MTNIMEKISEKEYQMMDDYIEDYAGVSSTVGSKKILEVWAEYKEEYLYKLFGGELILSKEIHIEKEKYELVRDLWDHKDFVKIRSKFLDAVDSNPKIFVPSAWFKDSYSRNIFDMERFAENKVNDSYIGWEYTDPATDKTYKITGGMKIMKAIGKIAEVLHMEDDFERLRIAHSQVLNSKKYTGELCLSIHPMDYMTMSDNANGWGSCMSWVEEGEYRQGTVEMMNSNCVVVAYLKSKTEKFYDDQWNSKKWRSLYIVHPNFITNVKGYPYNNTALDIEVLEWLKELAETNCEWEFKKFDVIKYKYNRHYGEIEPIDGKVLPGNFTVRLWTHKMYNDFGALDYQTGVFSDRDTVDSIYYSGPSQCMGCGDIEEHIYEPQDLACGMCLPDDYHTYCTCCGDRIYDDDVWYSPSGDDVYCEACYYDTFDTDTLTGSDAYIDDLARVYIVRSDDEIAAAAANDEADDLLYMNTEYYQHYETYRWERWFGNAKVKTYKTQPTRWGWYNTLYYVIPDDFDCITDYFMRNYTVNGWDFGAEPRKYVKFLNELI